MFLNTLTINFLTRFIVNKIVHELMRKNLTIAIAESCTGGMLSSSFVSIPNCSKIFIGGVVSYSNIMKIKQLEIDADLINKYGAVSLETAESMAHNIRKQTDANIGLSITGIAGPTGGTPDKPVGTVYIACDFNGICETKKFLFSNMNRNNVRNFATYNALKMLENKLFDKT
jgi:PncC family amidohydrolase